MPPTQVGAGLHETNWPPENAVLTSSPPAYAPREPAKGRTHHDAEQGGPDRHTVPLWSRCYQDCYQGMVLTMRTDYVYGY